MVSLKKTIFAVCFDVTHCVCEAQVQQVLIQDIKHSLFFKRTWSAFEENIVAVLLDVINCFRDIFKFFLIKENKVPKRSVVSQHSDWQFKTYLQEPL